MSEGESREWGSKIKEIGESIVGLSVLEAKELGDYLEEGLAQLGYSCHEMEMAHL